MKKPKNAKLLLMRETLKDLGARLAEVRGGEGATATCTTCPTDSCPTIKPATSLPTNFYSCGAPPPVQRTQSCNPCLL